jgi:hypothetical protein
MGWRDRHGREHAATGLERIPRLARVRRLVGEQVQDTAAERSYLQVVGEAMARAERFGDLIEEISAVIYRVVSRLAGQ